MADNFLQEFERKVEQVVRTGSRRRTKVPDDPIQSQLPDFCFTEKVRGREDLEQVGRPHRGLTKYSNIKRTLTSIESILVNERLVRT